MGCCDSGGGGGGETKFEWNDDMAPYWRQQLASSLGESQTDYQRYSGDRIAGVNGDQEAAMGAIRHFFNSSGSPATQAANGELQRTLEGDWLGQDPTSGQVNPWQNASATIQQNQYMGMSPEFQAQIDAGMGDITKHYREATDPSLRAAAVLNGTYGGGDHMKQQATNEEGLAKQLTRYGSDMRNAQWDRSGQLREADIGRDLQDQQFDKQLGGTWYQGMQDRDSNSWNQERGRMQGAVAGGQNEQNLALQRYNAMLGVGDMSRGFQQQHLDLGYQNWQDQQNWDKNQLGWMGGMLGAAQGGMSPNMQQTPAGSAYSPFSNILGGALASYGMFRS